MPNFLITYVDSHNSDVGISPQVYPVSHVLDPDDVTVPERTIAFLFVSGNFRSAQELRESIMGVSMGKLVTIIHSAPLNIESPLYCIGREEADSAGNRWIINPYTKTRVASWLLGTNYTVIDM